MDFVGRRGVWELACFVDRKIRNGGSTAFDFGRSKSSTAYGVEVLGTGFICPGLKWWRSSWGGEDRDSIGTRWWSMVASWQLFRSGRARSSWGREDRDSIGTRWWSMVASWQLFRGGRARSSWGGEDRDSTGHDGGARWLRGNCSGAEEHGVLGAAKIGIQRDTNDGARWLRGNCSERKSTGFLGRRRSEFHRTGWWSTVASWQLFRVVGLLSIAPRRRLKPCRTGGWGWWLGGSCSGAEEHGVLGAAEIRIWLDTQGGASWLRTGSSGSKEHGVFGRRRLELCGDTGVGALSLRANCSGL
jgi:hypothetical protein